MQHASVTELFEAVVFSLNEVGVQSGFEIDDTAFVVHVGRHYEDLCFHTILKK